MSNVRKVTTTEDLENLCHSILAEVKDIGKRVGVLEANASPRHNLLRPEATKVVKTKTTKKAKVTKTPREASASLAHQGMKAELKTMPKEVQKAFSEVWMAIRQDAGYGKKGNIPLLDYFELQSDAFKAVVGA
jgi:hypothetical protein